MEIKMTPEALVVTVEPNTGTLHFHPEVLQSFHESNLSETKVVIIGVIGEPNSNKTFIANSILRQIQNSDQTDGKWIKKWTDDYELTKCRGRRRETYRSAPSSNVPQGILIRSCSRATAAKKGNGSTAVVVLDILARDVEAKVYCQLVDCIITMSSIIIYAGKAQTEKYMWSPERSLVTMDPVAQLFIVLQEPPLSCEDCYFGSKEENLSAAIQFLESNEGDRSEVHTLKNLSNHLRSKYQCRRQSCHLIPSSFHSPDPFSACFYNLLREVQDALSPVQQPHSTHTIFQSLPKLFLQFNHALANNGEIKAGVVTQTETSQENGPACQKDEPMDVDPNSSFTSFGTADMRKIPSNEHDKEMKTNATQPEKALTQTSISPEDFYLRSFLQHYETEFKTKVATDLVFLYKPFKFSQLHDDICQRTTEKCQMECPVELTPEFMNRIQVAFQPIYSHFESINSINLKRYEELSATLVESLSTIYKKTEMLMLEKIQPENYNTGLLGQAEIFFKSAITKKFNGLGLEGDLKRYGHGQADKYKAQVITELQNCVFAIAKYEETMGEGIRATIYVNSDEFKKAHGLAQQSPWKTMEKPERPLQIKIVENGINLILDKLEQENQRRQKGEEKMAERAVQFGLKRYHDFMSSIISTPPFVTQGNEAERIPNSGRILILTEAQIAELHQMAVTTLLGPFLDVPGFFYTKAWECGYERLKNELTGGSQLEIYLQKNRTNIRALTVRRRMATENANQVYCRKMAEFMQITQVNPVRLDFFNKEAQVEAIKAYQGEMGENLPKDGPDSRRWIQIMKQKLDISFHGLLVVVSDPRQEIEPPPLNAPSGVGIYWTPSLVIGTVCKKNVNFSAFVKTRAVVQMPPFIAFMNDRILYGEEAQQKFSEGQGSAPVFNLHHLLVNPPSEEIHSVRIYGETFYLPTEAILAIFLHKFKLDLEVKFFLENPISSAVLTCSPFMPTVAKHILKMALFLSGFQSSRLIHSTTAAALAVRIHRAYKISRNQDCRILVVHSTTGVFDISCLNLTKLSVEVGSIFGLPDLKVVEAQPTNNWNLLNWIPGNRQVPSADDNYFKALKNLIHDCLRSSGYCRSSYHRLEETILIQDESERGKKSKGQSELDVERIIKGVVYRGSITQVDEFNAILAGAAALNFYLNQNSFPDVGDAGLDYTDVSPFGFDLVGVSGKSLPILNKNDQLLPNLKLMYLELGNWNANGVRMLIKETSGRPYSEFQIPFCVAMNSEDQRRKMAETFSFRIGLTSEGLIKVAELEIKDEDPNQIQVKAQGIFMDTSTPEIKNLRETIKGIFPVKVYGGHTWDSKNEGRTVQAEGSVEYPANIQSVSGNARPVQPIAASEVNLPRSREVSAPPLEVKSDLDKSREKLANYLKVVEDKLAGGGGSTNKLILARIQVLMAESQSLLDAQTPSVAKLSAQLELLEKAAARIKM